MRVSQEAFVVIGPLLSRPMRVKPVRAISAPSCALALSPLGNWRTSCPNIADRLSRLSREHVLHVARETFSEEQEGVLLRKRVGCGTETSRPRF